MNFIKEQLKDFWQYFKLFGHSGSASSKSRFKQYIYLLVVCIFTFIFMSVHLSGSGHGVSFNYTVAFLGGFGIGVGFTSSIKPSILTVSPFSPKQRTVFNYLVCLVYTLIYTVIVTVVSILFILIIALFAFLASGENIFIVEETFETTSGWSDLLCGFVGLYYFFSMFAITHMDKRKIRNITITLWFVVTEALMLVLVNVVSTAANGGVYPGFEFTADLSVNIDKLAHPWLPGLIAGLLSAAAFGVSIYTSYRCHRSRNF